MFHKLESAEYQLPALERIAANLAGERPFERIIEGIVDRADAVVPAPGHLLAVCLPDGSRRVSSRGTGSLLVDALNSETSLPLTGPTLAGLPIIAVPVASSAHTYGVLAATAHHGAEFRPHDEGTLACYARHAAAEMDIARLLFEARKEGETARLLLEVAGSLNKRCTVRAVAQSVADAIPALSGADRSAVALWDADAGQIRIGAVAGWGPDNPLGARLANFSTSAEESPELASMLACTVPLLVNRAGSTWARKTLDDFNLHGFVGTPITTDGRLIGIVLAGWADRPAPTSVEGALSHRLAGLAGLAGVALDNIQLLERTQQQAFHDPLTSLPNRTSLEHSLEAALVRAAWTETRVGLLFCDLNRFKRINDSLGHSAGDQVLQHVAERLRNALREGDIVARYSGDEFVVLTPDLQVATGAEVSPDLDNTADRIRAVLSEPFELNGKALFVDAAIGTALSEPLPPAASKELDEAVKELVERADAAMYSAKAKARGQSPDRTHSPYQLRLETELRGAAGRGELQVHFQPQIDLITHSIVALEALVRWEHPELGLIPPDVFIPLAEETHLINEVGAYVLSKSCQLGTTWHANGYPVEIAVNISAKQLNTPGFSELVTHILQESGLPAAALVLEITETQVISEVGEVGNLWELKKAGVKISIDDFGTGYSSLTQLHRLPVSEIKVDKTFTGTLQQDKPNAFVAGIIGLAHGLGLRVVAEGVETPQQLTALQSLQCERAQGYLVGKPTHSNQILDLLTTDNWNGP